MKSREQNNITIWKELVQIWLQLRKKKISRRKKWQKNVIIVKDAIADRIPGVVYWNLFDMEMNFAKTMSTDNAIKLIEQYS